MFVILAAFPRLGESLEAKAAIPIGLPHRAHHLLEPTILIHGLQSPGGFSRWRRESWDETTRAGMCLLSPAPLSIAPTLVPDGQAVESLPVGTPLGHVVIHECGEAGIMGGLQEVNQFVDHEIFEALGRLLG